MKLSQLLVATAVALSIPYAAAQDKSKLAEKDRNMFVNMLQEDLAEVEASKVAAQKATNPEVKKFAQHMVDQHGKMVEEGKQLAQKKGLEAPKATDKKAQEELKALQAKSGAEFDRDYIRLMLDAHHDATGRAERIAKEGQDPDLKAHAAKGAPLIKEHLAQARKLRDALGASAGGTARKK